MDQGNMNNYFAALETSYDLEYSATLSTIESIFKVFLSTEDLSLLEYQKGNLNLVERLTSDMSKLQILVQKRIDQTTAYLLERSHEVWKRTNEATFCAISGDWKLYLWVNHAKNPRLHALNEPSLAITITIPKVFTFANVAIRAYHQVLDPHLSPHNVYISLGGFFAIDILAVPAAPRSAKGWTFEHVHLGYPFPVAGSGQGASAAPAPLGLEFPIPATIIVPESLPEIGWWDEEEEVWKKDGISNIEYDRETHKLKFQTLRAKPHAMIQSRVKHFPFRSWILNPLSECKAVLTLHSREAAIKIEVGTGWCKLVETPYVECKYLIGQEMDPIILLKKLSRCGLHLMPVDTDGQFVKVPIKESTVECYACYDLALAIPGCALASSKWNHLAGKDSCVARILEIPEPQFPPTLDKSKDVNMLLYKEKGVALLNLTEWKSKEFQEDLKGEYHASLIVALGSSLSKDSMAKIEKGDPAFTECFKHLAMGLRLFSFTSDIVEEIVVGNPLPPEEVTEQATVEPTGPEENTSSDKEDGEAAQMVVEERIPDKPADSDMPQPA